MDEPLRLVPNLTTEAFAPATATRNLEIEDPVGDRARPAVRGELKGNSAEGERVE